MFCKNIGKQKILKSKPLAANLPRRLQKKSFCGDTCNSWLDHLKQKNQSDSISVWVSPGNAVEFLFFYLFFDFW